MKKISYRMLFIPACLISLSVLPACTEVVTQQVVYSENVVTPVAPYAVTAETTYRSTMVPTRYYNNQTCVSQSYYLNDQLCPRSYRGYGYRTCQPKNYYCWTN